MPSPMPVLYSCSRSCSARSNVCRASGRSASWGIWLTSSASTDSRSPLFKSRMMVAGDNSSLNTTGFALFIECLMLSGKTSGRKEMFAHPGGSLLLRDGSKIGRRWRKADAGCLRLFQRIIQLPRLVDVADLQGLKRIRLDRLPFQRRMVSPPLTLQEPVVNNCRADGLSKLRSIRRFVSRNPFGHFANDACRHSKLAGQRCFIRGRKLSQPIEVSLNRAANLESGLV